ncbi:ABC transporter substrate-binding protein [Rhodobacter lacus]|uniref:ABC transporter substrate-binding protein n=1 Tax=Rhodobacter lacus TaxID=1641972 RepID=A0ABW5A8S9_9RHOB
MKNRGFSGRPIGRREALGLIAAGATLSPSLAEAFVSAPYFAAQETMGALPPVAARLPDVPRVIDLAAMGRTPGQCGGTLRMVIGGQRDVRYMPILGYARLLAYTPELELVPDLLRDWEVEGDRIFTLHLRPGHRWSDGHPFTAEDFRYCWEDVIGHPELGGMPPEMLLDGRGPKFEILDKVTVRYSWHAPLPEFPARLAEPVPLRLFLPAHYLKAFHARYTPMPRLEQLAKHWRVDDWSSLHQKVSRSSRPENPDLPTLEPWRPRTSPPSEQFVFERNAYFHRVDSAGVQLPYIDRFEMDVSSYDILPAKVATGESDLQATGLEFSDYTLVKEAETRFPIKVALWTRSQGSRVALMPNLNCLDPVWNTLWRDVTVRRALSLAIDRDEINQVLFFGLATPSQNTILPESVLYQPHYASAWASHDPEQANALLDRTLLGLRHRDGFRRMPDGKMAGLMIETAGESSLQTDVLEMIRDHFRAVGLAVWTRNSQRELFRSRALAGMTVMSVWNGLDNALPTPEMPPYELAPTAEDQLNWPRWGAHYVSQGRQGIAPDMPEALMLLRLLDRWRGSTSQDERTEIWHQMLALHADQVFSIGTVNAVPEPVVRSARLRNLPETGLIGYVPTSILGVYMPDTFWLDDTDGKEG